MPARRRRHDGKRIDPIAAGLLPDTDDYMRLVQVFGWLDGAGWRGLVEQRLNPPDGTPMHS